MKIWLYFDEPDDDGMYEREVELPSKFEVCPSCGGKGTSSAYLGAFTEEDMAEAGYEFMEDYMAGHYDRACDECKGQRVIEVIDRAACDPEELKVYDEHERDLAEMRTIEAAERRMGA